MIAEDFVIIPLEVQGIVPYGIGSVRIRNDGSMEFIAPSGNIFGREVADQVRAGLVKSLLIKPVRIEARPGESK